MRKIHDNTIRATARRLEETGTPQYLKNRSDAHRVGRAADVQTFILPAPDNQERKDEDGGWVVHLNILED